MYKEEDTTSFTDNRFTVLESTRGVSKKKQAIGYGSIWLFSSSVHLIQTECLTGLWAYFKCPWNTESDDIL